MTAPIANRDDRRITPTVLDLDAVRSVLRPEMAIAAARTAFLAAADGSATSPTPWHLEVPKLRAEVHVKGGYIRDHRHIVVKVATGFFNNPDVGLPSADGMSIVLDAATGQVAAVLLDHGYLTDLRTAAAGAVATDLLARRDAATVAVLGSGGQARYQLDMLRRLRRPTAVALWGRTTSRAEEFARWARAQGDWVVTVAASPADAVRVADMVITVTPSESPLFPADAVRPGTHITAVGSDSPGKRELDTVLIRSAELIAVDDLEQSAALGELQGVSNRSGRLVTVGDVISGRATGRLSDEDVTIADLTGIGTEDVAIAELASELISDPPHPNAKEH